MLNVTFLPKKYAPKSIEPVTYHVNQWNNIAAELIARKVFKEEYGIKVDYYDAVAIAETRVL